MRRRGVTIARSMAFIAIFAVNAALIRAFLVHEMFIGVILLFFSLQIAIIGIRNGKGRRRRFCQGFVALGVLAIIVLFSCELFPKSACSRMVSRYTVFALNLAIERTPTAVGDYLDEHQDDLYIFVYFLPELAVASAGGAIAAFFSPSARNGSESAPESGDQT